MGMERNIRKVTPYTPGEQPKGQDLIKLNTNENPYPPSPRVAEALRAFDVNELRLYPDPKIGELTQTIAARYGVSCGQVFTGVGSDDVLAMLFLTFFNSGRPILFADITYTFYEVWAELFRIPYEKVPLREDFTLAAKDYKRENGGIIIANPNAPTGVFLEIEKIEEIVAANPESLVIVDEAYVDFGAQSALPLIEKYENLIVVQTFSKARSAAGLRVGYAFGKEQLIKCLNDVKYAYNSYTLNRLQQVLAVAEMEDEAHFKENCQKVIATREKSAARFRELGFSFPDSCANFLFVTHPALSAAVLFEALRARGIYVRYFKRPRIDGYLRVSIGTDEEMDRLFSALEEIIKEQS